MVGLDSRLPQYELTFLISSSLDATLGPKSLVLNPNQQGEMPWPVISNLSPARLTRTASNFMDEWEKSLRSSENAEALVKGNVG